MCPRGDASTRYVLSEVTRPDDPRLVALSELLERTFADPDSVLGLGRIQQFLADNTETSPRWFSVLVLEESNRVAGGSVFSYVPRTLCGFSEYLVVERESRGQGLGRKLFDRRKAILDARANGHCRGLFIEVDSPERTPPELLAAERETSLEVYQRLQLFAHLGFRRVEVAYVQPALGAGKQAVEYLDLLFSSWQIPPWSVVPLEVVTQTLAPIWSAWAAEAAVGQLEQLRRSVGSARLLSLAPIGGSAAE
jgi:GNAT superfamily N-acetyltransferase